ncbi:MAG: alpha/beta hydrolase family protein [Flavobacteriaceae bacterium]
MVKQTHVLSPKDTKPILTDVTFLQTNKPKPIVVFCHGYKGFKDWGCWNLLAKSIAESALFFLKFNFSHNGGTIENPIDFPNLEAFGENNFSKELNDLNTVLNWINSNENPYAKEFDPSNIILLGHSRGGGIVTIKAAEDKRIKKLVTLAAVSDYKSRFPIGPELEYWKNHGVAYIENTRTKQQMPHYFQFYEDFITNETRLTISRAAKELNVPHLIIHGTADETVAFKEAESLFDWSTKSELFAIEDANHVFGSAHPWSDNTLPEDLHLAVKEIIKFSHD